MAFLGLMISKVVIKGSGYLTPDETRERDDQSVEAKIGRIVFVSIILVDDDVDSGEISTIGKTSENSAEDERSGGHPENHEEMSDANGERNGE